MLVTILGFDPGTANFGYVLLEGDTKTLEAKIAKNCFGVLHTTKWKGDSEAAIRDRIDYLGDEVVKLIGVVKPTHVVMEDFVEQGVKTGTTYKEMAFLTEHLRLRTRYAGCAATIYPNAYWKQNTLKAGKANKQQVKHYVARHILNAKELLEKQPDHVWDSAAIAYCKFLDLSILEQLKGEV